VMGTREALAAASKAAAVAATVSERTGAMNPAEVEGGKSPAEVAGSVSPAEVAGSVSPVEERGAEVSRCMSCALGTLAMLDCIHQLYTGLNRGTRRREREQRTDTHTTTADPSLEEEHVDRAACYPCMHG
jgi:hypothetical protein